MNKLVVLLLAGLFVAAFLGAQMASAQQTMPTPTHKGSTRPEAVAPASKDTMAKKSDMEDTHRMSRVIGKTILDKQNHKVGKVEDLIVDNGRCISHVVIAHGGLLGIGEKYVEIPWDRFAAGDNIRMDSSGDIMVNITKEELEKAPIFKRTNRAEADRKGFRPQAESHYPGSGLERSQGAFMERGAMTPGRAGFENPATSGAQTPAPGMQQAPSTQDRSKMDTDKSKMETQGSGAKTGDRKTPSEK